MTQGVTIMCDSIGTYIILIYIIFVCIQRYIYSVCVCVCVIIYILGIPNVFIASHSVV